MLGGFLNRANIKQVPFHHLIPSEILHVCRVNEDLFLDSHYSISRVVKHVSGTVAAK